MKYKTLITFLLISIIFINSITNANAAIIEQEKDPDGIITYYVSNEEDKFLAFSLISARMETKSRILYTDKYIGDIKNVYDFTDYRYYLQNNVQRVQHGIGSYTGSGVIDNPIDAQNGFGGTSI